MSGGASEGARPDAPRRLPRAAHVALALATIAVGLAVHRGLVPLGPRARDATGDALWAAMIVWWVGALRPRWGAARRAVVALGVCWAVEASQLVRAPALDAVRRTTLGHLVLGSDFDARDLAAYALGVLGATLVGAALARLAARGARASHAP